MACISGGLSPEAHRHLERLDQRRRNVDKQRRRLLAERLSESADFCSSFAYTIRLDILTAKADEERAQWFDRHASKLRTIAARLRGTDG